MCTLTNIQILTNMLVLRITYVKIRGPVRVHLDNLGESDRYFWMHLTGYY